MAPSCLADNTHDSPLSNLEKWFCNALARAAQLPGSLTLGDGGGYLGVDALAACACALVSCGWRCGFNRPTLSVRPRLPNSGADNGPFTTQ